MVREEENDVSIFWLNAVNDEYHRWRYDESSSASQFCIIHEFLGFICGPIQGRNLRAMPVFFTHSCQSSTRDGAIGWQNIPASATSLR